MKGGEGEGQGGPPKFGNYPKLVDFGGGCFDHVLPVEGLNQNLGITLQQFAHLSGRPPTSLLKSYVRLKGQPEK